ncbi:MAG: hypothetical protein V3S45_08080 [Kiloniellales bacterium]
MPKAGTTFAAADRKIAILLPACVLAIVVAAFFASGGHFNVDEGIYHQMVRDLTATGGFGLWNGYADYPSAELVFPVVRVHDGRLISQYPQLYAFVAAPFYAALGYEGLFLLNALAFAAVVWLTFRLARRLFGQPDLALNACLILVFATFAWEYSQATMPHALSMLCVMGVVALGTEALLETRGARAAALAFAAGLVAGLGIGIRLDVVFVLPALAAPFLFVRPWRPWQALAAGLGALPGLALMAALNLAKFGLASPFSYGPATGGNADGIAPYLPVAALGAGVVAALWIASRPACQRLIHGHRRTALLGLGLAAAGLLLVPQVWALAARFADGLYQLLVDMRIRDLAIQEGGLTRGPGGGMVYLGALKKSLLQSCPYLVVLAVPLAALFARPADRLGLGVLFLVPAIFVAVYSYFAWHGGQALNLRYFVPILPFTAILTAYAWRELTGGEDTPWRRLPAFAGIAMAALYFLFAFPGAFELERQELVFLTIPLVLAGGLLIVTVGTLATGSQGGRTVRRLTTAGLMTALVWAGLVAFTYDLPRSYILRQQRAAFAETLAPRIEEDSLLFVYSAGPFFGLFERGRVRIATPPYDDYRDFAGLAAFHLEAGRPVYAWLDERLTQGLEERGLMDRLRLVTVFEEERGRLVRITGLETAPGG